MTQPQRLFHVTKKDSVDKIVREGLKPYSELDPRYVAIQDSFGTDHGLYEVYFVYGSFARVAAFSVGWVLETLPKISLLKPCMRSRLSDVHSLYPFDDFVLLEYNGAAIQGLELAEHETYFPGKPTEIVPMASTKNTVDPVAFVRSYEFPDISQGGEELVQFEREARTAYVSLVAGGIPQWMWEHKRENDTAESLRNKILEDYGKNLVPCLTKAWWVKNALKVVLEGGK